MDYSLDTSGFFNDAGRRLALETAASEIGVRLNDSLAAVSNGTWNVTHPVTGGSVGVTFSVPTNAIRIFAGGRDFAGGQVGEGGWRTNSGARSFNSATDFQPYVGFLAFDTAGTTWDYTGIGGGTDFKAVARHELLHVLGMGGAATWDALISGGVFTGANARAANGGVNAAVTSDGGHFVQTVNSIMRPIVSDIESPTALDYGALDDVGWDVTALPRPGVYEDVYGRTSDGTWWVSRNGNGLFAPESFGKWNESANWRDVSEGDFNNDGRTDVVGRTAAGQWWVGLSNGSAFASVLFDGWNEAAGWRDVKVGDFNGDGRDDVAGRSNGGQWWVGLSTGGSFTTTPWAGWTESAGWRDVSVGDFNADGRSDLAGRTSGGQWWVSLSTGGSFATTAWTAWTESAGWRDVQAADFNGDGRTDIVGRTYGGQWWVAQSSEARFQNLPFGAWTESAGWRGVLVADFVGDARPDLIARTAGGAWYVGETTVAGFVFRPYGVWTESSGWRDVTAGNFAGSGKADIVARTADGSWWVGENTGAQLAFRSFGGWNESLGWRSVLADKNLFSAAQMGSGGQAVAFSAATSPAEDEPQAASVPIAAFAAVEPGLMPAVRGESALPADDREAAPAVTPAATEPRGPFDVAFADGGLLEALLAAV